MGKLKKYINTDYEFDKPVMFGILSALWAVSGIYGFLYEFIFYYFNGGMKDWYWRGGCFGPWIVIYGIGGLLIYFLTYRLRKKPFAVFLVSGLSCGALEFLTGAAFYYLMDGKRNWDYNTEILNFGNINGFVCLRSVLIFAVSGLLLVYLVVPLLIFLAKKMNRKLFLIISIALGALFLIDVLYNSLVASLFQNLYTAVDLYGSLGFKFMKF